MGKFNKNVLRLSLQNKLSLLSSILIIALGIFTMVSMLDTLQNLNGQISEYYLKNHLADIFVQVEGISREELEDLQNLDGIAAVDGRISAEMRLLRNGQDELSTVHLISYKEDTDVNTITLSSKKVEKNDIFIGSRMSDFYKFKDGENIYLLNHGESVNFEYKGRMNAPDYIYLVSSEGSMVPDGKTYDVACIPEDRMKEITGKNDSYNELGFILEHGYKYEDVRYKLTGILEKYGLKSIIKVEDQVSYNMVSGEMKELISTGTALPVLFMLISVFMLYVVLKKMIDRDQTLIGSMKAFGFSNRELMWAYLPEGAVVGIIGALLGSLLAKPFGKYMFNLYTDYFNLPETTYHSYWNTRIGGLVISLTTSILAVFFGIRAILKITPAMAMKSRSPKTHRGLYLPKFILKYFNKMERIGLRAVIRHPFRGFLIVLAVAFPFSIASMLFNFVPTINVMMENQFNHVQKYDLMMSLDRLVLPNEAEVAGRELSGVSMSEAILVLPIEISNENLKEFGMLYGMPNDGKLWNIMDVNQKYYKAPENGIILNQRIADKLHVKRGDIVELRGSGLGVKPVELPVIDTIVEIFGSGCYISIDSIPRIFNSPSMANRVVIKAANGDRNLVISQILGTSRVVSIVDTKKIVDSYVGMMDSMVFMINIFAFMAILAGAVLIYNISMINIKERFTELGTLMVLGADIKEVGHMIMFEHIIYFVIGILLGFPGSYGIKYLLEVLIISDSFNMKLSVMPTSYIITFLICLLMIFVAWQREMSLIKKIALTDILKERE